MNTSRRPIRTTLILGLICGLFFIPLRLGLSSLVPWSVSFLLAIWLYTTVYGILLCRWGGKGIGSIVFPILLLLAAVFLAGSQTAFLVVALLILSWIRSGICFDKSWQGFLAELVISLGGGAFVAGFAPGSDLAWALGIWMFFLVQTLYFVFFEPSIPSEKKEQNIDPFETSRRMVEEILA